MNKHMVTMTFVYDETHIGPESLENRLKEFIREILRHGSVPTADIVIDTFQPTKRKSHFNSEEWS